MPSYRADWFTGHIPSWTRLFKMIRWRADEPKVIVEIGSHEGRSAFWMMDNLLKSPGSVIYCIDDWEREVRHRNFQNNLAERPDRDKVRAIRSHSFPALVALNRQRVIADFIYIDGSHLAPEVLSDLVLAFQLLRKGGLMICDDYLFDNPAYGGADIVGRPKIAIDAFTTIYARKIKIIEQMPIAQVAFIKQSD